MIEISNIDRCSLPFFKRKNTHLSALSNHTVNLFVIVQILETKLKKYRFAKA